MISKKLDNKTKGMILFLINNKLKKRGLESDLAFFDKHDNIMFFLPIGKTRGNKKHIAFSKIITEILTELNKNIPGLHLEKVPYKDVNEYQLLKEMPDLAIPLTAYNDNDFRPELKKRNSDILEKEFENIIKTYEEKHRIPKEEFDKLVDKWLPFWKKGQRHEQAYIISIIMRKQHVPQYQAKEFIGKICEKTNDNEKEDRLKCVEDAYAISEDELY